MNKMNTQMTRSSDNRGTMGPKLNLGVTPLSKLGTMGPKLNLAQDDPAHQEEKGDVIKVG
jgi:hypothetical protein